MSGTITAANAVYMLSIANLYPIPQQLQGFSAEDVFETEAIESAEIAMGVDGHLAAGFKFVPVKQTITLMADSASNDIFEFWQKSQVAASDLFFGSATVRLTSIGKVYTCTRGVLSSYPPMADAKTMLQPRKYQITWERVSPQNI